MRSAGPDFAIPVARNGYAWWYLDALSDDGAHGLTIIAFVGSVFSPYYKWARRAGEADPMQHCALNVALYGRPRRWAMTERAASRVLRTGDSFVIGPSEARWIDGALVIDIRERCAPIPAPLRGRVIVRPRAIFDAAYALDPAQRHRWRPIAPSARVEVAMDAPGLVWSGEGYLDHNIGDEPVDKGFQSWDWSRVHAAADTLVHYDARTRDGASSSLALRLRADGGVEHLAEPPSVDLPPTTIWRIPRKTRADGVAQIVSTLEDTPFYARSTLRRVIAGETLTGFHESLDLDRFNRPIVQAMLPFRMPRITW